MSFKQNSNPLTQEKFHFWTPHAPFSKSNPVPNECYYMSDFLHAMLTASHWAIGRRVRRPLTQTVGTGDKAPWNPSTLRDELPFTAPRTPINCLGYRPTSSIINLIHLRLLTRHQEGRRRTWQEEERSSQGTLGVSGSWSPPTSTEETKSYSVYINSASTLLKTYWI